MGLLFAAISIHTVWFEELGRIDLRSFGALNRNTTSSGSDAEAKTKALQRDHDGSILKDLPRAIERQESLEDGQAILGRAFGDLRQLRH